MTFVVFIINRRVLCKMPVGSQTDLLNPAGTSIVSDICNLSNISDIAPLTLGSMEKSFFYHLFCVTQETYLSKDLGEIYI